MLEKIKQEWFSNIKKDIISTAVIGLVLIPETIGFSFIAGVSPMIAFRAVLAMSIIVSIFGARKGMISSSAGSMALVLAIVVRKYGAEYILPITFATGIIQMIFSFCKVGNLIKYIPEAVMHGFVNALGILIFTDQLHYFNGQGISMYILVILGLIIIYLTPKITKKIPPAIIAIIIVTAITLIFKFNILTLGGFKGVEFGSFKFYSMPIRLTVYNIGIIILYAFSLAVVGSVESLLTAKTLDEMTSTSSNKNRECFGQGLANVINAFFGGMAGCALVGQSIINTKSGGKTRLSTLLAGVFLTLYVIVLMPIIKYIPIAAVVSVMIMIAETTINWKSIVNIKKNSFVENIVMIVTVITVLITSNLAIGVIFGVIVYYLFKLNLKELLANFLK